LERVRSAVLPAYARVWVSELRDRKIRVNVLTPGQVATPLMEEVMSAEMKAVFESVIPRRDREEIAVDGAGSDHPGVQRVHHLLLAGAAQARNDPGRLRRLGAANAVRQAHSKAIS
jgi:NAD(P)-dependent dehydrogenase (short-subunit alcohol dehydrogenase family)